MGCIFLVWHFCITPFSRMNTATGMCARRDGVEETGKTSARETINALSVSDREREREREPYLARLSAIQVPSPYPSVFRIRVPINPHLDHVHELDLIRGGHDDDVRQRAEVGEVEAAVVRRAVVADESRAVEDHPHRQLLDHDVVHHLHKHNTTTTNISKTIDQEKRKTKKTHTVGERKQKEGKKVKNLVENQSSIDRRHNISFSAVVRGGSPIHPSAPGERAAGRYKQYGAQQQRSQNTSPGRRRAA